MLKTDLTHPRVLELLAQCGHGDTIAIVDSNYPAQARRARDVPIISLNITHNIAPTALVVGLVSQTVPIESCILPVPAEELASGTSRRVHEEIRTAVEAQNRETEMGAVAPSNFYELTSAPNLGFMIVTGERSHFGSALLTVGYLPEL